MKELAKELDGLVEVIHWFSNKGWSPATSTNYSVKVNGDIYVSRSGVDKPSFTKNDLLKISPSGELTVEAIKLGHKSSAETDIHLFLYELFPTTGCILHTHSLYGTFFSNHLASKKEISWESWEIQKGIKGNLTHEGRLTLPIVSNSQDMKDITSAIKPHLSKTSFGFLIAGHGLYAWGENLFEAKRHIETFEFLLELKHLEKTYGKA
jgi:methylthioribulose-1-phosphate dehydratase